MTASLNGTVPCQQRFLNALDRILRLRVCTDFSRFAFMNLLKDAMRGARQSVQDTILPVGQTRFHAIDIAKIGPLQGICQVEKLMKEMRI